MVYASSQPGMGGRWRWERAACFLLPPEPLMTRRRRQDLASAGSPAGPGAFLPGLFAIEQGEAMPLPAR